MTAVFSLCECKANFFLPTCSKEAILLLRLAISHAVTFATAPSVRAGCARTARVVGIVTPLALGPASESLGWLTLTWLIVGISAGGIVCSF